MEKFIFSNSVSGGVAILQVVEVSVNQTQLDQLCAAQTLAAYLADTHPVTTVTATMQTVLCSIATELPEAFRQFIDDQAISAEVTDRYSYVRWTIPAWATCRC